MTANIYWKNVSVLIKLARSQWKARSIIKNFRPQVAVGVGGYASGPTLKTAGMMGVPTLIQEQNSYAGVTNKLLAQKAKAICVAYDGMEKFFPADKIIMTGNPVRQNLTKDMPEKGAALRSFNLQPDKKTILIVGGSLGARTINNTLTAALATIKENNDIQFIWQTGKYYYPQVTEALRAAGELPKSVRDGLHQGYGSRLRGFRPSDFTCGSRFYFRVLSVAQACGSGSFAQCGKEDHQTKNALALVDKQAAIYVKDSEAEAKLMDVALSTVADDRKLKELSENIAKLALPDSARIIAQEVIKLAEAEN